MMRLRSIGLSIALILCGCRASEQPQIDAHAEHARAPVPARAETPATAAAGHVHPVSSSAMPEEHVHEGHVQPASSNAMPPGHVHPDEHAGHGADEHAMPEGYAGFTIDLERARALGLSTTAVGEQDFKRSLRTVGIVTLDETRTSRVHAKVRGFIERISADFVGKPVRQGQPLVSIYSQEVYAAELEFLSVLDQPPAGAALSGDFAQAERTAREKLLAAGRRRLSLWDVPKGEIARLERTRTPERTFTLIAPRTGIVVAKQAIAGMYVDPSLELYLISDLRKLWVLADVYETDISSLELGSPAKLHVEGATVDPISAKVAFIPPTVDEATRTLKVRFAIDNPDGHVRPGAFATVEMDLNLGRGVSVPEDAVIHTGPRAIVFVVGDLRIEPREVTLGPVVAGRYRVEHGLHTGERVATGAQFLLDSESRLRATSAPGGEHAGHAGH